jgi:hypothetical protein
MFDHYASLYGIAGYSAILMCVFFPPKIVKVLEDAIEARLTLESFTAVRML